MLDHIQIEISDIKKSKEFYLAALAPLGYKLILEFEGWLGRSLRRTPKFKR